MKVIYQGKEIEIDDTLEKGEKELDQFPEEPFDLEDTLDFEQVENWKCLQEDFEKTREFDYEQH